MSTLPDAACQTDWHAKQVLGSRAGTVAVVLAACVRARRGRCRTFPRERSRQGLRHRCGRKRRRVPQRGNARKEGAHAHPGGDCLQYRGVGCFAGWLLSCDGQRASPQEHGSKAANYHICVAEPALSHRRQHTV